jgi:predicted nuclease of predicted toxin-antitoxin system
MKILLDSCVWGGARQTLADAGHDVIWSGDWLQDPGDEEILAHAHREGRVMVTLDKDFGELAVVYGRPHAGILRLVNLAARRQGPVCRRILESHGEILQAGAIITADGQRLRIRPPDS